VVFKKGYVYKAAKNNNLVYCFGNKFVWLLISEGAVDPFPTIEPLSNITKNLVEVGDLASVLRNIAKDYDL